ncbi:MAG: hypothetical protein ABR555_19185 [Pyrinomonadaceae bacterium]
MKFLVLKSVIMVSIALFATAQAFAQEPQKEAPLTNAAVMKLTKAGFKERTIIAIISARLPKFDLSAERMIELKHAGVTENVIVAMLARQEGVTPADSGWDDDPFFANSGDPKLDPTGAAKNPDSSTDIFGSSGGVKGSNRSRGGNSSVSGDTVTTGSATVHILRPPTEAGGGPAKLEKKKSLTNDSIVELVEAGFSEGTIIRRIEQSPVEFDLATAKLDDLRKHRVSEKILTAMKAAMGDDTR